MPTFEGYADVDVSVDEFLSSCSKREIDTVIEWLSDENYLSSVYKTIPQEKRSLQDEEWIKMCDKLTNIRLQINSEDEKIIRNIIKKY